MAMEGTVKVPGIGEAKKRSVALVSAGLLGILGIGYYRSKKQSQQQSSSTDSNTSGYTDPNVDPATGLPYGSVQDQSALYGQGYGTNFGYGYGPGYVPPPVQPPGPGTFTSNAQWAQAAEDYLVNNTGADAATAGNAIGKYLTGQPVTPDQVSIIDQAIAFENYPPVSGPNGMPPSMNTKISGPPPVPHGNKTVTNLKAVPAGQHSIHVSWSGQPGSTYFLHWYQGTRKIGSGTTKDMAYEIKGLQPNTSYHIFVRIGAKGPAVGTFGTTLKAGR